MPPPPPVYQVTSDIPPTSPYHYSPTPTRRRNGILGGLAAAAAAAFAYGKWVLLLIFKIPAAGTLISLVVSFGGYALFYGPWFAVALLTMIFVHEMGHVVEIRRQGMQATAPIFIPFLGAAIFQRSHPTDALKQAQIGIAGPIAGTIGATVAFALYGTLHSPVLLLAALIGFYINLFNLIPIWQLDGSWILAPVSKWFMVGGYALLAVGALFEVRLLGLELMWCHLALSDADNCFRGKAQCLDRQLDLGHDVGFEPRGGDGYWCVPLTAGAQRGRVLEEAVQDMLVGWLGAQDEEALTRESAVADACRATGAIDDDRVV